MVVLFAIAYDFCNYVFFISFKIKFSVILLPEISCGKNRNIFLFFPENLLGVRGCPPEKGVRNNEVFRRGKAFPL